MLWKRFYKSNEIAVFANNRKPCGQIGLIFAHWVNSFLEIAEVAHIFGLLFPTIKVTH
jgi:hypothetical protein